NFEHVAEGQADHGSGDAADQQGRQPAHATLEQQHEHDQEHAQGGAEHFAQVDVGHHHQAGHQQSGAGQGKAAAAALVGGSLAHLAQGESAEQRSADDHAGGDDAGEQVGTVVHAGDGGEVAGQHPDGDAQGNEDEAEYEVFHGDFSCSTAEADDARRASY